MNIDNNTKHTVNNEPLFNAQKKELPPHANEFGFMGEDMGVDGRMGDYSSGVTNKE